MRREDRSRSIGDNRLATYAKPTSFEMSIGDFVSIECPSGRHARFSRPIVEYSMVLISNQAAVTAGKRSKKGL
jgi:hypothetical protein